MSGKLKPGRLSSSVQTQQPEQKFKSRQVASDVYCVRRHPVDSTAVGFADVSNVVKLLRVPWVQRADAWAVLLVEDAISSGTYRTSGFW